MDPQVSIVIPLFNAETYIARTIESALAQPVPAQVVVIDDGSSDGGLEVARRYADRIELETGPNGGAPKARNRGLALARAPYVTFLDADDHFVGPVLPGALAAAEATGADIVFSPMEIDGRRHEIPGDPPPPEPTFDGWLAGAWVCTGSVLWRRDFVAGIGGWDEGLRIHQDGDRLLRGLLAGARLARNREGATVYDTSNAGSISRSLSAAKLEALVEGLETIRTRMQGTPFAARTAGLDAALYGAARRAFVAGHPAVGRKVLAGLRARGALRHVGGRAHVLAASVLGLETKVRLFGG